MDRTSALASQVSHTILCIIAAIIAGSWGSCNFCYLQLLIATAETAASRELFGTCPKPGGDKSCCFLKPAPVQESALQPPSATILFAVQCTKTELNFVHFNTFANVTADHQIRLFHSTQTRTSLWADHMLFVGSMHQPNPPSHLCLLGTYLTASF